MIMGPACYYIMPPEASICSELHASLAVYEFIKTIFTCAHDGSILVNGCCSLGVGLAQYDRCANI